MRSFTAGHVLLWLAFILNVAAIPFQGVNLPGLEFYTPSTIDNSQDLGYVTFFDDYSDILNNTNGTFKYQINHFTSRGYNMFRVPFSWQRLQNQTDGSSPFNQTYLAYIQDAVSNITAANASVIVDVHNYARVNGSIIGQDQDAPTSQEFADFWVQLATLWANQTNVWFGIMNEPWDLDMGIWSQTLQLVVMEIRMTAKARNTILLPGNNYTGLTAWLDQSYAYLHNITDPNNDTASLVYDIHHYWDGEGGNTIFCNDTAPLEVFPSLTANLSAENRQAFLSETGWGNGSQCVPYITSTLLSIDNPSWLGYTAWGAGEFAATPEQYSYDEGTMPYPDALTLSPNPITGMDTPQFTYLDTYRNGSVFCICGTGCCCPANNNLTMAAQQWGSWCPAGTKPVSSGNSTTTSATPTAPTNCTCSASATTSTAAASSSSKAAGFQTSYGSPLLLLMVGAQVVRYIV